MRATTLRAMLSLAGALAALGLPAVALAQDETAGEEAAEDAGKGAELGALAGGLGGVVLGVGMITIPGLGPAVAFGWLVSAAVGAAGGALVS